MSDIRAAQAREHHQEVTAHEAGASRHRIMRDRLVLALREDDPKYWTYRRLADEIGCSHQLIMYILRPR
jgi:hypothetical protein